MRFLTWWNLNNDIPSLQWWFFNFCISQTLFMVRLKFPPLWIQTDSFLRNKVDYWGLHSSSHNINKWLESRQMEEFLKEGESNFVAVSMDSRIQTCKALCSCFSSKQAVWKTVLPVQKSFPIDRQTQHRAVVVWSASTEVLAMSTVLNSGSLWALPRALKLVAHLWVAHKGLLAFEVLFVLGCFHLQKKPQNNQTTIAQPRTLHQRSLSSLHSP